MRLYVRKRTGWVTFIHNTDELKEFVAGYIPGRKFILGDLCTFNRTMLNILLKFIEENPSVECFTSRDLSDPVLVSRFIEVIKEPVSATPYFSVEDYQNSSRDYMSSFLYLSGSVDKQIRAPRCGSQMLKLLLSL